MHLLHFVVQQPLAAYVGMHVTHALPLSVLLCPRPRWLWVALLPLHTQLFDGDTASAHLPIHIGPALAHTQHEGRCALLLRQLLRLGCCSLGVWVCSCTTLYPAAFLIVPLSAWFVCWGCFAESCSFLDYAADLVGVVGPCCTCTAVIHYECSSILLCHSAQQLAVAVVVVMVSIHSCMRQAALVLLAYLYLLRPVAVQKSLRTDGRYLAGT